MTTYARSCVGVLGGSTLAEALTVRDAVSLLEGLRDKHLSPKTIAVYYQAFRRMLALNDVDTVRWPKAPTPPRKTREAMTTDDLEALIEWLRTNGYAATADLGVILRGTGARVSIEGLSGTACRVLERGQLPSPSGDGQAYLVVSITGKGGHERTIPVVDEAAVALFDDPVRMAALMGVSYKVHLKRWNYAVKALGITTKKPTPHSVRHFYANDAYRKSGGDLIMVQELLGHTDPATTAKYLGVGLSAKARALAND